MIVGMGQIERFAGKIMIATLMATTLAVVLALMY